MDDVEDLLKSPDELFKIDRPCFAGTVEDYHQELTEIQLDKSVPVEVRQLFETAKNVMLYARFAYRFHQVAEMVSYSALEFSLKELFTMWHPTRKVPHGLSKLLKAAKKDQLFENDYFGDNLISATQNGIKKELEELAEKEEKETGKSNINPYRDITDEEIKEGVSRGVAVDGQIKIIAWLRNDLAHGSSALAPHGFLCLRRNAELINYLYRKSREKSIVETNSDEVAV